jgi:hypothetical protein
MYIIPSSMYMGNMALKATGVDTERVRRLVGPVVLPPEVVHFDRSSLINTRMG